MRTYEFSLTVHGQPEGLSDGDRFLDLAERIYGAFEGDVEVEMSRGVVYLRITREAVSMAEAIRFSVRALEGLGLRAARFGPESLVSASQIAARLNLSRERVSQLLHSGALPTPVAALDERSPMYRWADIVGRLAETERVDAGELEAARSLERANAALTIFENDTEGLLQSLAA
jgi:hypothetical protein